MRLDHVSYACTAAELVDVVQRIGSELGGRFADGGRHPRFGTRNFVLPLRGGVYVEVVAALDHPAADKVPFGKAVRARAEAGGGWLGWAVAVDDLAPVEARLGRAAVVGARVRPDGHELRWRQIGILDLIDDPQRPFFTRWDVDPADHPGAGGDGSVGLAALELVGDPATLAGWLGGPPEPVLGGVGLVWREPSDDLPGPGLVAVRFATAHGEVCLD